MKNEATIKILFLILGCLLETISIINYSQYPFPSVMGILLGFFFIAGAFA